MAEVQKIADCEEEPGAHGASFTENLLSRRPAIVIKPDKGYLWSLEALQIAL